MMLLCAHGALAHCHVKMQFLSKLAYKYKLINFQPFSGNLQ